MMKFVGGCRYCDAPFFAYGEETECDHKSDCTRPGPVIIDDTEMSSHEISIHNAALEEAAKLARGYPLRSGNGNSTDHYGRGVICASSDIADEIRELKK